MNGRNGTSKLSTGVMYKGIVVYKQDTLYEMRWNPASPGRHQYATDIAWAAKQAIRMEKIYECFTNPAITFDIPI